MCECDRRDRVTVHMPLSREVFWHKYAKIPRHTSKNAITEGDFKCIFARNCEGTEQLRMIIIKNVSKELIRISADHLSTV